MKSLSKTMRNCRILLEFRTVEAARSALAGVSRGGSNNHTNE